MKVFIDLCSGLGGASQAFVDDPEWTVYRFENNPILFEAVPFTFEADVTTWMDWLPAWIDEHLKDVDEVVIWASPPCREFSEGYNGPKSIATRAGEDYEPDMTIFQACLDIIEFITPNYWMLENVKGSIPFFTPEIGKWKQRVFSFYLWGNFPHLDIDPYAKHFKSEQDVHSANPLRANLKGKVPIEVSSALLTAIDNFTSLEQWM